VDLSFAIRPTSGLASFQEDRADCWRRILIFHGVRRPSRCRISRHLGVILSLR